MSTIRFNVDPTQLFPLLGQKREIEKKILMLGCDEQADDLDFVKMQYIQEILETWPESTPISEWETWASTLIPEAKRDIAKQMIELRIEGDKIDALIEALPKI